MRRSLGSVWVVIMTCLLFFALTAFAQASSPISIIVDGNAITSDVPPQIINGSTMVPVRVISEALGASVSWDSDNNTVTLLGNGVHIAMTLGGYTLKNGSPITLDNPAQLINGRVMVPIRFIAEAFGCQVNWDASNDAVEISSAGASATPAESSPSPTPQQVVGALQAQSQIQQAIAADQQKIGDLNTAAQNDITQTTTSYENQIQYLKAEENLAVQSAVQARTESGGYQPGATAYVAQQVENEYEPQITQMQNEEQDQINQINSTLQQQVSQLQSEISNYQSELQ